MAQGDKPTHILRIIHNDVWCTVGAAWLKPDGQLSLTINQGCVIDWKDLHVHGARLHLIHAREREDGPR